jgi:cellulose synthase/poly-beta-1,6-N-acetylglucosamine synthase-like glycosyltransferase
LDKETNEARALLYAREETVRPRRTPGSRRRSERPLFGELAVEAGLLPADMLTPALDRQKRWGGSLGEVLVSTGAMSSADVARLYGRQRGVPCIDLRDEPRDPALADPEALDFYLEEDCMPWQMRAGETIYIAGNPDKARTAIATREGRHLPVFVTSQSGLRQTLARDFAATLTDRAVFGLMRQMPESSAALRLTRTQIRILAVCAVFLLAMLPSFAATIVTSINIALGLVFIAASGLRYTSIFVGLTSPPSREEMAYENQGAPQDPELPVYTVMVPLFREARVLPILARALQDIDYPASKLDIKLIFEESDPETLAAAKALKLPDHFEFIVVPDSLPRTKPKACNFALPFARGGYLVIYDAEDSPEPLQLKKAVAAFEEGDKKLACVQAQLNYYNWNENWLTRQFAIEYAAFFDLLLPTMVRLGMPIPLGGTSTHFRTALLREAGAWDPNNVTEDADLGLRLALLGYRCGVIRSTTQEEANCRLPNWVRQRSRWIKGWMQTYLVRMRHPLRLYRAIGLRGFMGFQLLIGGLTLSSLVHPLFYVAAAFAIAKNGTLTDLNHAGLAVFNALVLVSGYSLSIVAGMAAVSARGLFPLLGQTLMMPVYWLLISIAAYKALWQLITNPFHWEKTEHGISCMLESRFSGSDEKLASDGVH